MLAYIRDTLRRSDPSLDAEITGNIETAKADLKNAGVDHSLLEKDDPDRLVRKAIENYCKWQFDFDGQGERHRTAYENLKACLSMSSGYKEGSTREGY